MNNVLTDLANAINAIPDFYYRMDDVSINEDTLTINAELSKHYERRFVSQLKSSYDAIISNGSFEDYSNVYTDSEVIKKYIYSNNPDTLISESYNMLLHKVNRGKVIDVITTIPDFLIHHAQSDWDYNNQKLVVEAKTNPNLKFEEFALDVFKLNVYAEKHNFQNSVYLIVHNNLEQLEQLFQIYAEEGLYLAPNQLQNIYLFLKPEYGRELEIYKFSSLF